MHVFRLCFEKHEKHADLKRKSPEQFICEEQDFSGGVLQMTILRPILTFAHALLESALKPGDIAVDCTMGNGKDTLLLASLVGERGHVFAFDIQASAIENTRRLLERNDISAVGVTLTQAGHESLQEHISGETLARCKAAVFNLGYLPGGDKQICTAPHTTIAAIEALLAAIAPGGLIVLVVYPGHSQGGQEAAELPKYCESVPREVANVIVYRILNSPTQPPFVIALEKNEQAD